MNDVLLQINKLSVFCAQGHVVDRLNVTLKCGEVLGVVGESGSGKTMMILALLGLLPFGFHASGEVLLAGQNLLNLDEDGYNAIRGAKIAAVFQDPMRALNPIMRIGAQIEEMMEVHNKTTGGLSSSTARRLRCCDWLERVGLTPATSFYAAFPHQLSGGQRQRVLIAMALASRPALLIADEPTSALDHHLRGEILALLQQLQKEEGMAMVVISHDLEVVARLCRRVLVFYAGRVVEAANVARLLSAPAHPYTRGLLAASPRFVEKGRRLQAISGQAPALGEGGKGCVFAPRCPQRFSLCEGSAPLLSPRAGEGEPLCACHLGEATP